MPHAAVREQGVAKKQMSVDNRAPGLGKSRRSNTERAIQFVHQGFDHRANISCRGRVEGRTDFEVDLLDTLAYAASGRRQAIVSVATAASTVRDFNATTTASAPIGSLCAGTPTVRVTRIPARDKVVRQIGRARKVIRNAAQYGKALRVV